MHDWRRLTRLRNNFAWLRPLLRRSRRSGRNNTRRGGNSGANNRGSRRAGRRSRWRRCSSATRTHHDSRRRRLGRKLGLALGFLLTRQHCLQYIAGLGDIGEIDLGTILLLASRTRTTPRPCGTRAALKVATHPLRLARFDGTRMGLAVGHTHRFQSIENLLTLDFQLTRQIVNSNLTHPPLFVVLPIPVNWS